MDFLQVILVFFILLLSVLLSVLGIQVFFILRDLKKSLDKLDKVLDDTTEVAQDVVLPVKAVAEVTQTVESGVKAVKNVVSKPTKPAKKLFKRR